MKKNKKKEYEKPRVTKVRLDAKCAVLGWCRTTNIFGPGVPSCGYPFAPCSSTGS